MKLSSSVRGWRGAIAAGLVMFGACAIDAPELAPRAGEATLAESGVALSVDSTRFRVFEGDVPTVLFVHLTAPPAVDVVVDVSSSNPGALSATPSTVTLNASNWSRGEGVTVAAVPDSNNVNETVTLTFSSDVLAPVVATVDVVDDDVPQQLVVGLTAPSVQEGSSTLVVVVPKFPVSSNFTVTLTSSGFSTVTPSTLVMTPASFHSPQFATVTTFPDANHVLDTVTVTASSPGVVSGSASIFVIDNG